MKNTVNTKKLLGLFDDFGITPEKFYHHDSSASIREYLGITNDQVNAIQALGKITKVDGEGGSDDHDKPFNRVYHFEELGVYLKITGYCTGYNGIEINQIFNVVYPNMVPVIVYRTEEQMDADLKSGKYSKFDELSKPHL